VSILRAQHALARLGYQPGPLDGVWGRRTREALEVFQQHAQTIRPGMQAGKLDGVSLAAMEWAAAYYLRSAVQPGVEAVRQIGRHFDARHLPALHACLTEIGATPLRAAHLLAQVAWESGEFRYSEEIADGSAYEGREDLGNTERGDGRRYKGRGVIQLTGRANYRAAGAYLGLDLEGHPEQAGEADTAWRVVAWYWLSRGINHDADADDVRAVTRDINGGTSHLREREQRLTVAKRTLGITKRGA
jgi:predicted chitinase